MKPHGDGGASRVFRIFVSSTFLDFQRERQALQESVFPRLRQLCLEHGCRFLAVDLRWGIPTEAALDQRTVPICLDELQRCQTMTPRPNFLALVGDRYGWRPLVDAFPKADWQALMRATGDASERRLLTRWYRLDENAAPPVCELRPRTGASANPARWQAIEDRLREVIEQAARRSPSPRLARWHELLSVTEMEIAAGVFGPRASAGAAVVAMRRLQPVTKGRAALDSGQVVDAAHAAYFDAAADGRLDVQALARQHALRARLRRRVPGRLEYELPWDEGEPSAQRLQSLCEAVAAQLSTRIQAQIEPIEKRGALREEVARHRDFAEAAARSLIGRRRELRGLVEYLLGRRHRAKTAPYLLGGASGSGKSTLMGAALHAAGAAAPHVGVGRFVGATPESRNERRLLEGLCREIAARYRHRLPQTFGSFVEVLDAFARCLALARPRRPLIVVVDALDQLEATPGLAELRWIPQRLPPDVRMVVSCLPGPRFEAMRARLGTAAPVLELAPLCARDGVLMLDHWLKEARRGLSAAQRRRVLERLERCAWPLYLRLAAGEAIRWKSYEPPPALGRDVHALLRDLIERLSRPAHHGRQLVERSLAYLGAAREGLAEEELVELLSLDVDVMREFRGRSAFNRGLRQLPAVVWSRLFFDLRPLLTEVGSRRAPLLGFWHRQVREVVDAQLRTPASHRRLARYFEARTTSGWRSAGDEPDARRIVELPFQLLHARRWADALKVFTDFDFLQARCEQSSVHELEADFALALGRWPRRVQGRAMVAAFADGIRAEAHWLAEHPSLLFPQLYNRLRWTGSGVGARCEAQRRPEHEWLRALQDPRPAPAPWERSFGGHTDDVEALALDGDGRTLVSGSEDGTVRVWDPATGAMRHTLRGHAGTVQALAWLQGSTFAGGDSEGRIMLWDAAAGRLLRLLAGHREAVEALAAGAAGRWIFSGSGDGTIAAWDAASGRLLRSLDAHAEGVLALAVARDGSLLASGGRDRSVKVWSLPEGRLRATLAGHAGGVSAVALAGDGRTVISGSLDKTIKAWDWTTQRLRWTTEASWHGAHCEGVTALAVSADDATVVSGGLDCRIVVTDLNRGRVLRTFSTPTDETGYPLALVLAPRGNLILAGCADHQIHVWGQSARARLRSFGGHEGPVEAIATAADGARFVSASQSGELRWWEFASARLLRTKRSLFEGVSALAASPDGRTLYVGRSGDPDEGPIEVLDFASGRALRTLQGHQGEVAALAPSPDGRTLVSGSWDGTVKVWELNRGSLVHTLAGHGNGVTCVLVTPDGEQIVSGSADATIRRWDLASGALLASVRAHAQGVQALALSPDGATLFSAGREDTRIVAWRLPGLEHLATRKAHAAHLAALAVVPGGQRLVSAAWDGTARVWSLPDLQLQQTFDCDPKGVTALRSTPDGAHVLCGCVDGTVRAQRFGSDRPRRAMEGHLDAVNALAFTPDGRKLVSCSPDHRVRLWSVPEGLEAGTIDHRVGHGVDYGHLLSLAVGSDGRTVLWTCGSDIVESRLNDGRCLRELRWHHNTVTSLAMVGSLFATGSLDNQVMVAQRGRRWPDRIIDTKGEVDKVALSLDGAQVMASFSMYGVVEVWSVASGRRQFRLQADDRRITALAVAGTAPLLLAGSANGTIRAWSIARGVPRRMVRVFEGHDDAVPALVFDAAGARMLSVSSDGTMRAWSLAGGPSQVLFASDAPLTALAASRDGRYVACGDTVGRIRLFERMPAEVTGPASGTNRHAESAPA